jgi:cytochrome c-type biogenesis protein CcmH/NrfG
MKNKNSKRFSRQVFYTLFFIFGFSLTLAQENYFDLAKAKYNQKLFSEAISILENGLKQNPKNEPARKLLGQCYLEIRNFDQASAAFEQARQLKPDDAEITILLDNANRAKKEQSESLIQVYTSYLNRHPRDDEYRLKLARAYKEYGDFTTAQKEYLIYLTNDPNDAGAKEEYLSLMPKPVEKKSAKAQKKITKTKPKNNNPNSGFESSLTQPFISQKQDLRRAGLTQARDLVSQEKYVNAESLYETYLTKNPYDTTAWREYAQMLSWNKQYAKSVTAYRRLLILNPNDKKSALELAEVLSWAEDFDAAITQYLALDTTKLEVLAGLAQAYYWKGAETQARTTYEKILGLDPSNAEAKKRVSELKRKAIPGPEFSAEGTNLWDSEEFSSKGFDAALRISLSENTSLEPGFVYRQFEQKGDFIAVYSYSIRINELLEAVPGSSFKLDIHYAYNYYDCLDNTHSYGVGVNYAPYRPSIFNFSYDHHDIIQDVSTTRSLIHSITTDNFEIAGTHQFDNGLGIAGSYLYGIYSDNNQLQNPQVRLFDQLFKILRVGYAYYLTTYSDTSSYYWTPDFYQTHSLWFELSNGSKSPLSYYVSAEIAKVTNSPKLARSIAADFLLKPSEKFNLGLQFSYSELSRTADEPPYWYQSLSAYLKLKL